MSEYEYKFSDSMGQDQISAESLRNDLLVLQVALSSLSRLIKRDTIKTAFPELHQTIKASVDDINKSVSAQKPVHVLGLRRSD